jgi:CRISPR system Cascade subunit CasD
MLAAALGRRRDEQVDDLRRLRLAVRVDRTGSLLRDFHTVGGGLPNATTVATAEGKRRPGDTATLVSRRAYLQDAAFTLAVTAHDDAALLEACADALTTPHWPPYLGRRSCPPTGPALIMASRDAWRDLTHLPLYAEVINSGTLPVAYYADEPLDELPVPPECIAEEYAGTSEINDEPLSFASLGRVYRGRRLYRRTIRTPYTEERCGGVGAGYLNRLYHHLHPEEATA